MNTEAFAGRLLPKETIVWSGRPRQGLMLTGRDAFLIPFSVVWCSIIAVWVVGVAHSRATFMLFFGIPFVLVGAFLLLGRFVVDAWLRARIYYALTDRRVLILREAPWGAFTALSLDHVPETTLNESGNGRGTIRFGPAASIFSARYGNRGTGIWTPSLDAVPQFLQIEDVKRVFAKVQEQTQAAR